MELTAFFARFAGQPQAEGMLFAASALEGALVPVVADDLLVPMVLLEERHAFRYALIATVGSVVGALVAFEVAFLFFQSIQGVLLTLPGLVIPMTMLQSVVVGYSALIVLAAGFSSAPYKIVTVLSGFLGAGLVGFVLASFVSRALRFFMMAWILWRGGPMKKIWLERSFYGFSTVVSLGLLITFTFLIFLFKTS